MVYDNKKTKQFNVIDWFKKIEGWQKILFASIILPTVTAVFAFTYQNAKLPADNKRMDAIQKDVEEIKVYIANDAVEKAVEKHDIQITKEKLIELKQDMKDNFDEIKNLLNLSYRLNKKIDENTK